MDSETNQQYTTEDESSTELPVAVTTQPTSVMYPIVDNNVPNLTFADQKYSGKFVTNPNNLNNNFEAIPTGLQYLSKLDQVLIKQQTALLEVILDWECSNKYEIYNAVGQQCFMAMEESNICCRQCCRLNRPLTMHITDLVGQDVFLIKRPYHCGQPCYCCACCNCCKERMIVSDMSGEPMGYVSQRCSFVRAHVVISDMNNEPLFEIVGPYCAFSCCGSDVKFPINDIKTGEQIGQVGKQWSGGLKEMFTDADNFGVTFPLSLDIRAKATLIASVFLIDYMLFEKEEKGEGQKVATQAIGMAVN